jgi:uncharacterized protein (TIGR03032 family)
LILQELGISLLVTTYQAGKLVILRADNGVLNTHFRTFHSPMGLAADSGRLAVGTPGYISLFCNIPAVAQKLEPPGRHDACYLPRSLHVTGNIQVHEMAWGDAPPNPIPGLGLAGAGELWFVNTRFSCLCTLDGVHSFVPRWKPPFISELTPQDRCHLNGLGMLNARPKWVTALGTADSQGGWRAAKKDGGVVMDVVSGEIVARGLAMPHSPRWYEERLWVLNSGAGEIGTIDLGTGRYESIAVMPGFTRGLDFRGPVAFVGLSQVRETAVFSGIPIAEKSLEERNCGVWVVNIRTGQIIAFVKFEAAVQEIFAVQVLPDIRYPELLNEDREVLFNSFELPEDALRLVPENLRSVPSRASS